MVSKTKPVKKVSKSKKKETLDASSTPVKEVIVATPVDSHDQIKLEYFDKLMNASRNAVISLRRSYGYSFHREVDKLQDVVEKIDKVKFYSDHANIFKGYDNPFDNFKPY